MRIVIAAALAALMCTTAAPAVAQLNDPVVAHADPESLFTSTDPKLHRNKQAALNIIKVLLEANQWDRAGEFLTDAYIQHNPLAASGLDAVVHYFTQVAKAKPTPVPARTQRPIVAVQAEGDFVTVLFVQTLPTPGKPGQTYTTTWFDTWRFVDGKADEHWDPATLPVAPPQASAAPAGGAADSARLLADRAAIDRLMWDYVRAADNLDPDRYVSVFTPDGAFNQIKGRDALHKFIADLRVTQNQRRADGTLTGDMRHFMTNQNVEFVSPSHARVRYYWQTVFGGADLANPPRMAAAGNGIDDVVLVDGKWLIQSRNVAPTNE